MKLSDLERRGTVPNVVLLQCPSTTLSMFIEDKVKKMLGSNINTVFDIKTDKDLKNVRVVCNVVPFMSKKWLYFIDADKLKPNKEFYNLVQASSTVCYFITCSRYSDYKKIKESLSNVQDVFDFYLSYLKGYDMSYLYNEYIFKKGKKGLLSTDLYNYIRTGYSNDIDAVVSLFDYISKLDDTDKPITKEVITELCGIGGNTLESFVFTLLKDAPKKSVKSFNIILKKRVQAGVDLRESYDSWGQFYAYTVSVVKNITSIKMLLISNTIYKSIRNLPEGYDEKILSRYNRYLYKIKEIPLSRVLRLQACLVDSRWESSTEFLYFTYRYYKAQVISETLLREE